MPSLADIKVKPLTYILEPKELKEVILLPRVRDMIKDGINGNYLFYGPAGLGKSSICNLLSKDYVVKHVNASLNGGVDTLRDELTDFAMENAITFEKIATKVVYLDEFDGASQNFLDAFRGFTEQFKDIYFIATANKFHKLVQYDYIESRFNCINCAPENNEEKEWLMNKYKARFVSLAKGLKLQFESEEVSNFVCNKKFPDFRGIYKFLQASYRIHSGKVITMDMITDTINEHSDVYKLILDLNTTPEKIYEHMMINYSDRPSDIILSLDESFVNYIMDYAPHLNNIIADVVIENARHQHMFATCLDQTTVMRSLCFVLNSLVKKQTAKQQ